MDGLIPALAETPDALGVRIPLDLAPALLPYREHESLSIKIERLPHRARLSKGRNNGDHSWSLSPDDLDGLLYLPPDGLDSAHTLIVRIISLDSDSASTLVQFDVPISPGESAGAATPTAVVEESGAPIPEAEISALETECAVLSEEIQRQQDESIATGEAHAAEIAEIADRHADALRRQAGEAERRLAEAVNLAERENETAARARLAQTNEARLSQELGRQLADARSAWEVEQQDRITIAVQAALEQARTETTAQLTKSNEARLSQELGRQLADARAAWEIEQQDRVAAAVQEAVRQTELETTARLEQTNEARLSHELGRQLADARASWEVEHLNQVAASVQEAVRQAEQDITAELEKINEARHFQELGRRLADAHALWENEQQSNIAAAVEDAVQQAEARTRVELEQAQREWRDASAQEMAEISARCAQAEAALDDARHQPPDAQDTQDTQDTEDAFRALRDELASAQAVTSERELELTETRQGLERASAEISRLTSESKLAPAPSFREAELEFRLNEVVAEAEATLREHHAAWEAEREEILTNTEENAQQRIDQAFEQWQQETQAALSRAHQEWTDNEATRLAVAEAHWRENIGIARSRGALTEFTKQRRRKRITGRSLRIGIIAACLAGAAVAYPLVAPMISERWWPKITAYQSDVEPTLRKANDDIQSWLSKATETPEPRATVRVAAANVRATPSISAAVITTLPRNSEVTPLDRRGNWVRIRIGGPTGKTGWLHASLLKDTVNR